MGAQGGSGEGDGADGVRLWGVGETLLSECLFAEQLAERGSSRLLPLREIWGECLE